MTERIMAYPEIETAANRGIGAPTVGEQMGESVVEAAIIFATLGVGTDPEELDGALAYSRRMEISSAVGSVATEGFDTESIDTSLPTVHPLASTLGRFSTIHTADELSFALNGSSQFQVTNNGPYGQRMAG